MQPPGWHEARGASLGRAPNRERISEEPSPPDREVALTRGPGLAVGKEPQVSDQRAVPQEPAPDTPGGTTWCGRGPRAPHRLAKGPDKETKHPTTLQPAAPQLGARRPPPPAPRAVVSSQRRRLPGLFCIYVTSSVSKLLPERRAGY